MIVKSIIRQFTSQLTRWQCCSCCRRRCRRRPSGRRPSRWILRLTSPRRRRIDRRTRWHHRSRRIPTPSSASSASSAVRPPNGFVVFVVLVVVVIVFRVDVDVVVDGTAVVDGRLWSKGGRGDWRRLEIAANSVVVFLSLNWKSIKNILSEWAFMRPYQFFPSKFKLMRYSKQYRYNLL